MQINTVIKRFLICTVVVSLTGLGAANAKNRNSSKKITYGPSLSMGNGEVRTFVKFKGNGHPKVIGVKFDGAALQGLPDHTFPPSDGNWDILSSDGTVFVPCCGHEHVLEMPAATSVPVQHVVVNWNNHGHFPAGVYDVPHFDFHFYLISNEERISITAPTEDEMCMGTMLLDCDLATIATLPLTAAETPPSHMSVGGVEPGMGDHLIDFSSPEHNGVPFTHTWIFGGWNGDVHFLEPMITREYFLALQGKDCSSIKVPQAFAKAGYYPTTYCSKYNQDQEVFEVTLEKFEWFDAG